MPPGCVGDANAGAGGEGEEAVACVLRPIIHAAAAVKHLSGNADHAARMRREVRAIRHRRHTCDSIMLRHISRQIELINLPGHPRVCC